MFKLRILDTYQYSTVHAIDLEIIYKIYEKSGGVTDKFCKFANIPGNFHYFKRSKSNVIFEKYICDARSEGGLVRKKSKKKWEKIVHWSHLKRMSGEGVQFFIKRFSCRIGFVR